MPTLSSRHIDRALTNVSLAYTNLAYVADRVCPIVPVDKRSDKYFTYDQAAFLTPSARENSVPKALRRPGSEAAEIDYSLSTDNFYCEEYAFRELVTDAEVKYSDSPLNADIDATEHLTETLALTNEVEVATMLCNRSNYPSANKVTLTTGSVGTSWAQYSSVNSNPFNDIKNGRLAVVAGISREANTFLACISTARVLADHPAIKELTKYTSQESLTSSGLPKVLKGLNVIEAPAQKNTAASGAAYSGSNAWIDSSSKALALIAYVNPMPSKKSVAQAYTFEAPDDTTGARGTVVRRYRDEKRKGTLIEASFMRTWKLIAVNGSSLSTAGYLISDTVA